jgi:protein-disulfide isomerase
MNNMPITPIRIVLIVAFATIIVLLIFQGRRPVLRNAHLESFPSSVRDLTDTSINLADLTIEGSSEAPLLLIEFSDYDCVYCIQHALGVGAELKQRYVVKGTLRHAFAFYPLQNTKKGILLARIAVCAGAQERRWEVHESLFRLRERSVPELSLLANRLHVDADEFKECVKSSPRPYRSDRARHRYWSEIGRSGHSYICARSNRPSW